MSLATSIKLNVQSTITKAITGQSDLSKTFAFLFDTSLADGTGAGANNKQYYVKGSIANDASPLALDLSGALTNPATGVAQVFTKIKGIFIKNTSTALGDDLKIGMVANSLAVLTGGSADQVPITIGAGGLFVLWKPDNDGYPVTNSTGDLLNIAAAAGKLLVGYEILIVGVGA